MYLDDCNIKIIAGTGGNGSNSFRHEKYVRKGGPDGGNGGRGGSIFFVGNKNLSSLAPFKTKTVFRAENGSSGTSSNKFGKNGKDLIIEVPLGTKVYTDGELELEIMEPDILLLGARGGRGGRGNYAFKSSRRPAPFIYEKGETGEIKNIRLSLTVIADAGLVGFPSAGKTSFLNETTGTKHKTASYEFTTLIPQLGEVIFPNGLRFTLADLPGIIKDAHLGRGLGLDFLKHLERVKTLVFVINLEHNPLEEYHSLIEEIKEFNKELLEKEQVILLSKADASGAEENIKLFQKKYKDALPVSLLHEESVAKALQLIYKAVEKEQLKPKKQTETKVYYTFKEEDDFEIIINAKGEYLVTGNKLRKIFEMTDFNVPDNTIRFANIIKKMGIEEELIKKGATKESTIYIFDLAFELDV